MRRINKTEKVLTALIALIGRYDAVHAISRHPWSFEKAHKQRQYLLSLLISHSLLRETKIESRDKGRAQDNVSTLSMYKITAHTLLNQHSYVCACSWKYLQNTKDVAPRRGVTRSTAKLA